MNYVNVVSWHSYCSIVVLSRYKFVSGSHFPEHRRYRLSAYITGTSSSHDSRRSDLLLRRTRARKNVLSVLMQFRFTGYSLTLALQLARGSSAGLTGKVSGMSAASPHRRCGSYPALRLHDPAAHVCGHHACVHHRDLCRADQCFRIPRLLWPKDLGA